MTFLEPLVTTRHDDIAEPARHRHYAKRMRCVDKQPGTVLIGKPAQRAKVQACSGEIADVADDNGTGALVYRRREVVDLWEDQIAD